MVLKLVREDTEYWYFSDGTKYSKDRPFWWFKRLKPIVQKEIEYVFPYSSFSLWARQLAKEHSKQELQKVVAECEILTEKYAIQHLNSIKATISMQSNSQRRAQSRNNVTGNYERKMAYKHALEIHDLYPEFSKI